MTHFRTAKTLAHALTVPSQSFHGARGAFKASVIASLFNSIFDAKILSPAAVSIWIKLTLDRPTQRDDLDSNQ
jgi:hypothetical protein